MSDDFPSFELPPIVEVVCGVQFEPLSLLVPHLGKYAPEGFEATQEVAPLPPVFETFPNSPSSIMLTNALILPRTWYETKEGDRLIQVQRDRFLLNWRKTDPSHEYPRFEAVYQEFEKQFSVFRAFSEDHLKQKATPTQLELSYINHIVVEEGEALVHRLGEYLPDLSWRIGDRFLPSPESLDFRLSFALPKHMGRLHVRLQSGIRNEDQRPVLVLDLTARGRDPHSPGWKDWFELAHEWVVSGFCDLTGKEVQNTVWRRSK
jgi:uncharacterized protein (TIGR04255 family)